MQVRNATMTSEQVADFVYLHRDTVREFDFENVILSDGGSWHDALSPLSETGGTDEWLSQQSSSDSGYGSFPSDYETDQSGDIEVEVVDTQTTLPYEIPQEVPRISVLATKKKKGHRRRRRKHRAKQEMIDVSAPILDSVPALDILQPTVFQPDVQGVQRDIRREASQQELADDPEKRVSALKKAKEAVLKQLGREFSRSQDRKDQFRGLFKNSCSSAKKGGGLMGYQSNTALVPLMFSRC